MLAIATLLQNTIADGELRCECPHGQLLIEASGAEERLVLSFSNARTFRYFLDSIPGFSLQKYARHRGILSQLRMSIHLAIDGKPLLSAKPGSGKTINYGLGLKQWLLWKMGR